MTPWKLSAAGFAVAGLACAIVAAVYWFRGSREYPPPLAASISDATTLHLMNVQVSFGKAGKLNATAAIWTGVAAVLSASASLLGLF
jgi:hypothetical protein